MIPAVAQTLARILADGTSLSNTEQIDFNPPNPGLIGRSVLTVYCYNIQECRPVLSDSVQGERADASERVQIERNSWRWFELSFLVSAWDFTVLGENQLLSEVLLSLLRYQSQPQKSRASDFRSEALVVDFSSQSAIDPVMLWRSLGLPLRPALYVTVRAPIFAGVDTMAQGSMLATPC